MSSVMYDEIEIATSIAIEKHEVNRYEQEATWTIGQCSRS